MAARDCADVVDLVNQPNGRLFVATGNAPSTRRRRTRNSMDYGDDLVRLELTNGARPLRIRSHHSTSNT